MTLKAGAALLVVLILPLVGDVNVMAEECSNLKRELPGANKSSNDDGILVTDAMMACVQAQARKRSVGTDMTNEEKYVDFVLDMAGDVGQGITPAPPQALRIPVELLDKLNPTAQASGQAIRSKAVSLLLPQDLVNGISGFEDSSVRIGIDITADGWQERSRRSLDPDLSTVPWARRGPLLPFGLRPVVTDATTVVEQIYIGDDDEFGFVGVNCFGIPRLGPRKCRVSALLSTYLTLSVFISEDQLPDWKKIFRVSTEFAGTLVVRSKN